MRTGLAARRVTYLHTYPLYWHAMVPFGFPRQVSQLS
jgi:hypothetical protein